MEKILVYCNLEDKGGELSEFLRNKGYDPLLVSDSAQLPSLVLSHRYPRLFHQVRNLSDIRSVELLRSICADLSISLLVQPEMQDIINTLRDSNLEILTDFMQ